MSSAAAIYARLSTDDRQQTSLPRQIALCRQAAEQQGYEVPEQLIFQDNGYSGSLMERPDLGRMLALVRTRALAAVFVSDGDRLSREPAHDWLIREELKTFGVTLYVNGNPIDTSAEGEVKDGFLSLFAKYERLKTAQRMRRGKLRRAGLHQAPGVGRPLAGFTALGYRYVPDTPECLAHIELVSDEAELVRRIYAMCLSGQGIWSIARQLTREHVPTKMDRASSHIIVKQRARGVWSPSSIHKILHNHTYTGIMNWNKSEAIEPDAKNRRKPKNLKHPKASARRREQSEWLPIAIPPIIDEATFLAVQAQISQNAQKNPRRRRHKYMFLSGRLRCGFCGSAMSGYLQRGLRRYRCVAQSHNVERPCRVGIAAHKIEGYVWELLEDTILSSPDNLHRYLEQKQSEIDKSHDQTEYMLEQIGARLEEYVQQRRRLLDLYLHGHIDEALFSKTKAGIDQESESLEKLRSEMQAQIDGQNSQYAHVATAVGFVTRLLDDLPRASLEEKRRVIEALDVHVVYRDLDHMRLYFDLPISPAQSDADVDEFRWRGIASLRAIQWDNLASTKSE
jgi:site-specific DNA recombinase